jgi:hypothetical protein
MLVATPVEYLSEHGWRQFFATCRVVPADAVSTLGNLADDTPNLAGWWLEWPFDYKDEGQAYTRRYAPFHRVVDAVYGTDVGCWRFRD